MNLNRSLLVLALAAACASFAAADPCPPATGSTPALDQLKGAATTGDMSAVTGDGCTQTTTPVTGDKKTAAAAADTKKPVPPKDVPDLTDQQPPDKGPSFWDKVKKPFEGLPTNQMLAGAGFGALVGMIFLMATPVGLLGGAAIGAVVGAVLFSGLIGKLFGSGGSHTGGS